MPKQPKVTRRADDDEHQGAPGVRGRRRGPRLRRSASPGTRTPRRRARPKTTPRATARRSASPGTRTPRRPGRPRTTSKATARRFASRRATGTSGRPATVAKTTSRATARRSASPATRTPRRRGRPRTTSRATGCPTRAPRCAWPRRATPTSSVRPGSTSWPTRPARAASTTIRSGPIRRADAQPGKPVPPTGIGLHLLRPHG